jgi:hypothetical protein
MLGTNFGRDTGGPDSGYSWFYSVPTGKCQNIDSITASFQILSNTRLISRPTIRRYIFRDAENAVK